MSKEIVSIHKKIINPLKYSKKEREPAQKEHLYPFLFLNLTSCKNYRIKSRFIPWLWRHFYTRALAVSQVIFNNGMLWYISETFDLYGPQGSPMG